MPWQLDRILNPWLSLSRAPCSGTPPSGERWYLDSRSWRQRLCLKDAARYARKLGEGLAARVVDVVDCVREQDEPPRRLGHIDEGDHFLGEPRGVRVEEADAEPVHDEPSRRISRCGRCAGPAHAVASTAGVVPASETYPPSERGELLDGDADVCVEGRGSASCTGGGRGTQGYDALRGPSSSR